MNTFADVQGFRTKIWKQKRSYWKIEKLTIIKK